ncbi:MAG: putative ABC transporter permease subunit [Bacillota bacterium]|jgi:hypothetical protein
MEYVSMILKRDLRSILTPGGKPSLKRTVRISVYSIFFACIVLGLYYGSFMLFTYAQNTFGSVPGLVDALSLSILNGVALSSLLIVFMTGLQTTYRIVYESDDIGFLLVQPIPAQSVFLSKFIISYATLAALVLGFGLPGWTGWGHATGAGFWFYVAAFSGFAFLLLLVHSVVSLMLLVAMRYLPTRKMKTVFVAVSAIGGVITVLASQVISARLSAVGDTASQEALLRQIGASPIAGAWYLPSTWLVRGVLGTIPRFNLDYKPYLISLSLGALIAAYIAIKASTGTYLHGWSSKAEEEGKPTVKKASMAGLSGLTANLKGTYWAVLRKDMKTLFRDPVVWYSLVTSIIVLGFFIFNTTRSQRSGTSDMMATLVIMMAALMGAVTSAQTGGVSVSREGRSFWILQSNATKPSELFWAKMTYAFLPGFFIVVLGLVGSLVGGLPRLPMWLSLLLGAAVVVGVSSLQILLDVSFPDFAMKMDFGASKSGTGTGKLLVTMFASMGFVFLCMLVQFLPSVLQSKGLLQDVAPGLLRSVSYAAVVVSGLVLLFVASTWGYKKLKSLLSDS